MKPVFALVAAALSCAAVAQPAPGNRRAPPPDAGQPAAPAGPALSGRAAPPVALLFVGFDSDGDGRTTRAELAAGEARSFAAADANGDGALGLIELADWARVWLGDVSALPGRFDFDRDGDDRIARPEFAAELDRRFGAMDADKDGALTRGELLLSRQRPEPGRELQRRPREGAAQ